MPLTVSQFHPRLQILIIQASPNTDQPSAQIIQDGYGPFGPQQDVLEIRTHKDLAEVAGTFSIKFTARRDANNLTWAHKIAPMDFILIALRRDWDTPLVQNGIVTTEIIMRGFVDVSQLVISTSPTGDPDTYCLIEGRDYGKLFLRPFFFALPSGQVEPGSAPGADLLAAAELNQLDGALVGNISPQDWLTQIWRIFSDPKFPVAAIPPGAPTLDIKVGSDINNNYSLINPAIGPFTGSIWNYLSAYSSPPFFEMFITDDLNNEQPGPQLPVSVNNVGDVLGRPTLIWRRNPAKDYKTGKIAATDADPSLIFPDPPPIEMATDVISLQTGRSDQEAYNYFITLPAPQGSGDDTTYWSSISYLQSASAQGVALMDNALVERFGFLPLDPQLGLWVGKSANLATSTNTQANNALINIAYPQLRVLTQWLEKVYSPDYLLEQGRIVIKGNPNIKVGRFMTIKETQQQFYIEGVDHVFQVDPVSFQTSVTVTRGTWPLSTLPYPVITGNPTLESAGSLPPTTTTPPTTGSGTPPPPSDLPKSGQCVSAVGDSLFVGISPYITRDWPGMFMNAVEGRQLSSVISEVQALITNNLLGNTLVVNMGNNGEVTSQDFAQFMNAILNSGVKNVIIVNSSKPYTPSTDDVISEGVATYNGQNGVSVQLADWYSFVHSSSFNNDWLAPDGLHLSPSGYQAMSDFVSGKIKQAGGCSG